MAVSGIWECTFRVVNLTNAAGAKLNYFGPDRKAIVVGATQALARTALAAAVSLGSGESLEVIDVHQRVMGEAVYT